MKKLFGTDGVRGVANAGLTPEIAFQIGQAAGIWLGDQELPKRALIGRDTRRSGPMIGAALAAGLCSAGVDVVSVGVCPTGGICHLVGKDEFGLGAVVSASHNPAPDNGIKLLASNGGKALPETEQFIESHLGNEYAERPTGGDIGVLSTEPERADAYRDWLVGLVPERLDGMRVVIDAAHGSAYRLGIEVFELLGATVVSTGTHPDGMNINAEGGATKPETVQQLAQETQADLGVAYDGDADRAVFADSEGRLINGDRTMAVWCSHWRQHGRLDPLSVVGTVMSNGGFEAFMTSQGVVLHRVDVGDKYVSAKLRETGGRVGGEQSGHIIFPEHGPTGDGLVTALEFARVMKREGRTAAELFGDFDNWPQLLTNLEVENKDAWHTDPRVAEALVQAEQQLSGRGRINVRASGTQPILRVMVEADDKGLRDDVSETIVQTALLALGGRVYSRVDLTHALGD